MRKKLPLVLTMLLILSGCIPIGNFLGPTPTPTFPKPFPPMTYPRWSPHGLPKFISNVWPPPNSSVRFEDYDPFVMWKEQVSWGKEGIGIGVELQVLEVDNNPPIPSDVDGKYIERVSLYINGDLQSNLDTYSSIDIGFQNSYEDEEGNMIVYDTGVIRFSWEPKLQPGKYHLRFVIVSLKGVEYRYEWAFTLLEPE